MLIPDYFLARRPRLDDDNFLKPIMMMSMGLKSRMVNPEYIILQWVVMMARVTFPTRSNPCMNFSGMQRLGRQEKRC
jgi:hypothetical protein